MSGLDLLLWMGCFAWRVGALTRSPAYADKISGLQLINPAPNGPSDIPKDSDLSFRCFVNPALIPLYARTGPSLQVHTSSGETSEWLKGKLLGNIWPGEEELDEIQSLQCPIGLLLGVDGPARRPISGAVTSDLLVYGVLSCTPSFERPPTPPVSSSSGNRDHTPSVKRELRIYAAPLTASLITKAQSLPSPPCSPTEDGNAQFAEFLPDLRSPSPKRKRVATLFESAAQHHRRVRQKGGEAVSQMMASSQQSTPGMKREPEEPSAADRVRSKSISGSINPSKYPNLRAGHSRSNSVRGLHNMSGRSTPMEVSTQRISSPLLLSEGKLEPSLPKDVETIVSGNKNIITRTILTCMRLYGFNRTRPASGRHGGTDLDGPLEKDASTPAPDGPLTAPASGEEDEFRSMYHATYRASTFALRKYLKAPPDGTNPPLLDRGGAMGYIDEFLKLFCEDGGGPGTV